MAGSRVPKPLCGASDGFDTGTVPLAQSPLPGPVCSFRIEDMIAEATAAGTHTKHKKNARKHRRTIHHHQAQCPKAGELGALSAHYESGSRGSAAIGYDTTGGWSYGKYQIETISGTMKDFLSFAETRSPGASKALTDAGAYKAALAGKEDFKAAWVKLAAKPEFTTLQHDFIASRNYDPLAAKVMADTGLDVSEHSAALRDVVWSVAVQHGPNSSVITRALMGKSVLHMTEEQIIDAIYDERGATKTDEDGHKVLKYFSHSTAAVQKSVLERYERERFCAKHMLATGNQETK